MEVAVLGPNSPYGRCAREATLNLNLKLRLSQGLFYQQQRPRQPQQQSKSSCTAFHSRTNQSQRCPNKLKHNCCKTLEKHQNIAEIRNTN